MPSSGSGTGHPISPGPVPPVTIFDEWCSGAVSLARYARIIGYPECAFWGVNNAADGDLGCRDIWTKFQRDTIARYLCEAQGEIEQVIGFPLKPTWFIEEEYPYRCPIVLQRRRVIAGGVRGETSIQDNAPVNHLSDPATIGPIATTVTDASEIHVFYPDSEQEIEPSIVTLAGGMVTIRIPRCRMVADSLLVTPDIGLDYTVLANFQTTVDVRRIYNDTTVQAELVTNHRCSTYCAACGCSEYTRTACVYVKHSYSGIIEVHPASLQSGAWVRDYCGYSYQIARVNYYAGWDSITLQAEDAIIRLAHSKMPGEPCGCDVVHHLWSRDNIVPDLTTRERINCPFGMSNGAWTAWRFASAMRQVRMSVL